MISYGISLFASDLFYLAYYSQSPIKSFLKKENDTIDPAINNFTAWS